MIIRAIHDRQNPYFQIKRDTAQDKQLPARALGILVYLMSKPNDWEPTVDDICNRFPDVGRQQAYRIINETFIPLGYARRVCERENGRVVRWVTEIYETPHAENGHVDSPDDDFQHVEEPHDEIQHVEHQMSKISTIQINRVQNTDRQITERQNTDVAAVKPRATRQPTQCDEQWLVELQQSPAYSMLNVQECYYRMVEWCKEHHQQPTRRRFLGWLNREHKPMTAPVKKPNGHGYVGKAPPPPVSTPAPDADEFMQEHVDGLIARGDLIQLGNEYDAIVQRGGAKAPWEIAVVAYYELHKNEPASPEQMAELNASIQALANR